MNSYQTLHISYPVLVLTILSLILICFYLFLLKVKGKELFLLHFVFIILATLENIMENLFQPDQSFPPDIREMTGYAISAFFPYYIYKLTNFSAFKHYIVHSLFMLIPTTFFLFVFYPFFGSFLFARQLAYVIPACYALYAIPLFFMSIKKGYKEQNNREQYVEYIFLAIAIVFWSISPIVRLYLHGNRSATGIVGTVPIILFNIYIIIKELKQLVHTKTIPAEQESNICLSDYGLTPREMEAIKLVYEGKTYKDIGGELFISEVRVKQIVSSIYKKLGVENKIDLVKKLKWEETAPTK